MSNMTYKKITEVEQLSFLNDDAKLFINQDNAIKQYSAKQLLNEHIPEAQKAHQVLTTNEEGEKIWEDKLCYNYRVDYEVYAETIIPEGKGGIMPNVDVIEPIVKNESYIVTWDGVEYPCLAYAREGSDFGTVLGNEYLAYTDQPELDNGLPFLFIGFFAHEVMKLVYAADKNGHVFSVKGSKQTNTVIPGQYIAGGVYAGTGSQSTVIGDPLVASAPGNGTVSLGGLADGVCSVAEGNGTTHNDSQCAHAEGSFTHAHGWVSHVEGYGNTAYRMQHVQGRRAVEDPNSIYADIVGNGSQDGGDRSNAYALDWDGNAYFDGNVFVQGDGKTLNFDGAKKVATEEYVDETIANIEHPVPEVNTNHQYLTTNENGEKIWEDKLCYSYAETTEILAEQTLDTNGYLKKPAQYTIQNGQEYIVTYNGVIYNCLGNDLDGTPVLGNVSLMSGNPDENTGEPFLLFALMQNASGFGIFSQDGPHTFSVTGEQIKYKAIDGNYLAGGIFEGTGEHAHVFNGRDPNLASGTNSASFNDGDASGYSAFAIGGGTASGMWSFAGGENAQAKGRNSVAFGHFTIATAKNSLVTGSRNIEDTAEQYAHIIGNGNYEVLANIHTVDWKGNAKYAGDIYVNGSKEQDLADAKKVATEEYVDTKVAELVDNAPETLNTLKEVADALNENASTAEALNQAIGNKVNKTDYPTEANTHQYLTTDAEGNKVWENKLAYSAVANIPFLEELVWDGTQQSFPMAIADAQAGDKVILYIDDIAYSGVLEEDSSTTWIIKFDEDYNNSWIKAMSKFYVSKKGYNMNLGGAPLSWAVGKMSATVETNVVHPLDNKYLGIKINNGTGEDSLQINGQEGATGYHAISINEGQASGSHSLAIGSTSRASGTRALAAAGGSAKAYSSVCFGEWTESVTDNSMTIGTHNATDENKEYLFIVGNGSKGEFNPQTGYQRTYSNAHTVNKDGTGWFQKEIKVGGTSEHDENAKKLATEEYVEERLLDSDLVRATAFNELADTVKGLDKYCAFMKQGDQIKLGNVQEYSKMQEMLNGANKFHATLAISYVNEEGLLISETCYAKSVMSAIDMETGSKPYVNFSFETFDGETIKFRWNADNTISNVVTIAAISAEEAEV